MVVSSLYPQDLISFGYTQKYNLPIAYAKYKKKWNTGIMKVYFSVASFRQLNISKRQEELLMWHIIFGYYDITETQRLTSLSDGNTYPAIVPKLLSSSSCTAPLCRSYLQGKVIRAPMKGINTTQDPHISGAIRARNLILGDRVSID